MANVLNRTTKEYLKSVSTSNYDSVDWIINPDLSAVVGFESKYWAISGDIVTLMDQASRDAVDVTELSQQRDSLSNSLANTEDILRAIVLVLIDQFGNHATEHNALLSTISNASSLNDLKSSVAAMTPLNVPTIQQARTQIRNKLGSQS